MSQFGVCMAWPFSVSLNTVVKVACSRAGRRGAGVVPIGIRRGRSSRAADTGPMLIPAMAGWAEAAGFDGGADADALAIG